MNIKGRKSEKLANKRIALCVTGSIAALQAPRLARELIRHGASVTAYLTQDACEIIHPNAMQYATQQEVVLQLTGRLEHLAEFDLILVAPATMATIGKLAQGIADNAVTALLLSSKTRVLIAPAMHGEMYENAILQENIAKLKKLGYKFIAPKMEEDSAKLADLGEIVDAVLFELHKKDFSGLRVLVTAGPTIEYIDPIRIITNKSSGKTGIAIAREAYLRGADVELIYGYGTEKPPRYLNVEQVETTKQMLECVEKKIEHCNVFISAAAVSDFCTASRKSKIDSREGALTLKLEPTPKILDKAKKYKVFKLGFKALHDASEKELLSASRSLLKEYALDLVVANDVAKGIFRSDTSEVYIVDAKKETRVRGTKALIAEKILDEIAARMKG